LLSRDLGVPLVTEYNGSEVWIGRNWGKPAALGGLSAKIENLNLGASDLIVVVSRVLRDELIDRRIPASKILVNPNGVDTSVFHPEVPASPLGQALQARGKHIVGFIGTFGRWHGAEILVNAFAEVLRRHPVLRGKLHLLMIGDGVTQATCRMLANKHGLGDDCTFTGLVAQRDGPSYLAACNILVAPHVPNPDGSEFFGSPTKLFEYMAMGRPVVASRLGQIGDILVHGDTAWLVDPGDVQALADGLTVLIDNPALQALLGSNARKIAVEQHSWRSHVLRIADALRQLCQ
jgi:glycosyltransferase involved in cell wall biosynthesis